MIMGKRNELLLQAKDIVRMSKETDIRFVGYKPWYERFISKFKFGLFAGIATGLVMGLSTFALNNNDASKDTSPQEQSIKVSNVFQGKVIVEAQPNIVQNALDKFRKEHPELNFSKIKDAREVSKSFIGKNNFIALAAEMEGFRGDLHKDPATGLNIGFGYNITKRAGSDPTSVIADLQSIGISAEKVERIIEISKVKQGKLNKEIKKFNEDFNLENNQLITVEQGVALLKITEQEYKTQARESFSNSFDRMAKHQQEVLTYAAYKAGYSALSKYRKAINTASAIYKKNGNPNTGQLKLIAKELTFYYAKDGKEMVLDERATLIAHTFVNQDYLGLQIGAKIKNSTRKLFKDKIDFSDMALLLTKSPKAKDDKPDLTAFLDKLRQAEPGVSNVKKSTYG